MHNATTTNCQVCCCDSFDIPIKSQTNISVDFSQLIKTEARYFGAVDIRLEWETPDIGLLSDIIKEERKYSFDDPYSNITNYNAENDKMFKPMFEYGKHKLAKASSLGAYYATCAGTYYSVLYDDFGKPLQYMETILTDDKLEKAEGINKYIFVEKLPNYSNGREFYPSLDFCITATPWVLVGNQFKLYVNAALLDCNCEPTQYTKCAYLKITNC